MENIQRLIQRTSTALRTGKTPPDFWALCRTAEKAYLDKPRIGYAKTPVNEPLRFGQEPFLHFPASDIAEVKIGGPHGSIAIIYQYFFGLLGVNGPMPLEFTNYIFQRSHNEFDHTWRRFLDIIHHRFLTYFYRAHAMYEQSVCFDRPEDDPFSVITESLTGFSDRGAEIALCYARHFSHIVRSGSGLEDMLGLLLKQKVRVVEFVLDSSDIPKENRAQLGVSETARLGVNCQIGLKYLSLSKKIEIHIGPCDYRFYQVLIQGFAGLDVMRRAVQSYMDRPLEWDVVLHITSTTLPSARLGFDWESEADAAQLGYTCWLGSHTEKITTLRIDFAQLRGTR
jgi:type VI secretion system protein ImpH